MTDLTFTRDCTRDGLRYFDLKGPAGLIRFETHDVIKTAAVYLHGVVAPGGTDLEPCELCGRCWHDAMGGDHAQALREDWAAAAYHDAVIRTQLEKWYAENLAVWAQDQASLAEDPPDAPLLIARLVPDLPLVTAATIAAALAEAGYRIVHAASHEGLTVTQQWAARRPGFDLVHLRETEGQARALAKHCSYQLVARDAYAGVGQWRVVADYSTPKGA